MPNGQEMILELDFEEKIKRMSDRELSEFNSRQIYDQCQLYKTHTLQLAEHEEKINEFSIKTKKELGTAGGIGGSLALVLGTIILAVLKKLGVEIW